MEIRNIGLRDIGAYLKWHYEPPYDIYNIRPEDYHKCYGKILKNRENWYSVYRDGELIGIYEFTYFKDYVEIGLGLAPAYTGRSLGAEFLKNALDYLYGDKSYRGDVLLRVEANNLRAIKVYESLGFKERGQELIGNRKSYRLYLHMLREYKDR